MPKSEKVSAWWMPERGLDDVSSITLEDGIEYFLPTLDSDLTIDFADGFKFHDQDGFLHVGPITSIVKMTYDPDDSDW